METFISQASLCGLSSHGMCSSKSRRLHLGVSQPAREQLSLLLDFPCLQVPFPTASTSVNWWRVWSYQYKKIRRKEKKKTPQKKSKNSGLSSESGSPEASFSAEPAAVVIILNLKVQVEVLGFLKPRTRSLPLNIKKYHPWKFLPFWATGPDCKALEAKKAHFCLQKTCVRTLLKRGGMGMCDWPLQWNKAQRRWARMTSSGKNVRNNDKLS